MSGWTCPSTGVHIVEKRVEMFRVAQNRADRGPLNPIMRPYVPAPERRDWNRYDTPGLTIYGAAHRATAFTEAIAWHSPSAEDYASLRDEAKFLGVSLKELLDDLRAANVPVDGLDPGWRTDCDMYRLSTELGLWVDMRHTDTVEAIKGAGIVSGTRVTLADLMGEDRALTTTVSEWVRGLKVRDNKTPSGIRYPSKFGMSDDDDFCWAMYIDPASTRCVFEGRSIDHADEDLTEAVNRTGVHVD